MEEKVESPSYDEVINVKDIVLCAYKEDLDDGVKFGYFYSKFLAGPAAYESGPVKDKDISIIQLLTGFDNNNTIILQYDTSGSITSPSYMPYAIREYYSDLNIAKAVTTCILISIIGQYDDICDKDYWGSYTLGAATRTEMAKLRYNIMRRILEEAKAYGPTCFLYAELIESGWDGNCRYFGYKGKRNYGLTKVRVPNN